MRVMDIMKNKRNVKIEEITMHFEQARGLTFWKDNLRLILTDQQQKEIKSLIKMVDYFDGYRTKTINLNELPV